MKKQITREEKLEKLEQEALRILEKHKDIYFFSDLAAELGYARQYLYEIGFSPDTNDTIKSALDENKKRVKRGLRNKWYNNDNATTQVALYRLLADEDELSRLNNSKMEVTGAGGSPLAMPSIQILPVAVKKEDEE